MSSAGIERGAVGMRGTFCGRGRLGARARRAAAEMPTLARVVGYVALDRVRPSVVEDPARVPLSPETISPAWMTAALCRSAPGAHVVAVRPGDGTSGTTHRHRLHVEYDDAGASAGLPATVFTKSAPALLQRITQAVTGPVEAHFYMRLRPRLSIEAPRCYHGAIDRRRMTAITVLEDLVASRGATFLSPTTRLRRDEAEQIVDLLATVHGTFDGHPLPGLKTYAAQWRTAIAMVGIERYFLRAFDEGATYIAPAIAGDPHRAWRAVLASIDRHDALPATLIHNDVHLGNWYRTADGCLGLCDWQAVVRGHPSRDLAYALATTLTIEDRRAWERELVARHTERLAAAGGPAVEPEAAWDRYRQQLWGALAFWAPTFSPPRLMPSDMQPREISGEMLRRISTACADLDALRAVRV